jgi:hypothetical protein
MVLVVACLPLMIGFIVLVVDLGTLRVARQQAQMAADAAALASAGDVQNGIVQSATATTDANAYVANTDADASATVTTAYNDDPDAVKVTVSKNVPLAFARYFGLSTKPVSASAVASSNLIKPLAYFGSSTSDLQDGSATPDGWVNFCADDGVSTSTTDSNDKNRCPASAEPGISSVDGWNVIHGGVDISQYNFWSPPGTSDQMLDLTGTCVEQAGSYPSGHSGSTKIGGTAYDGYCENNADGEVQSPQITTVKGVTYTVTFELGSNTWGLPYEKALEAIVSTQPQSSSSPAIADTNGNDNASSRTVPYGTSYPLESNASDWNSSDLLAHDEFFYYGPIGDIDPNWVADTFTFKATTSSVYLLFGSLNNCVPDWDATSQTYFPSNMAGDSPGSSQTETTPSTSFVTPTATVDDFLGGASGQNYQNECLYGPGISDVTVTGPNGSVALTQ